MFEEDECDERDYCVPEDENLGGDYVSLVDNPERFTGYAGAGADNVWKSIYTENCYAKAAVGESATVDDACLEKRVFHRIISGMHSSISVHLCWDYLNQTTGEWQPNLDCFIGRFRGFPERIQNMYFNYAILLRAVNKLRNYVPEYTFCAGDAAENRATKAKVLRLANSVPASVFDESTMFQEDAGVLKEDFRNRFRNVSRVMDCVGCDKCRLWGKVQTQGYGTALKILFEFDEHSAENPHLRRTELVALVNTLDRVSHSLSVLPKFQEMWEARIRAEELGESAGLEEDAEELEEPDKTIKEMFWEELYVVWLTAKFVVWSWYAVPKIVYVPSPPHLE